MINKINVRVIRGEHGVVYHFDAYSCVNLMPFVLKGRGQLLYIPNLSPHCKILYLI